MLNLKKLKLDSFAALGAQGLAFMCSVIMTLIIPKILGVESFGYWQLFIFYSSYVSYFQIGLVMLMGLAAKNAILIVEFALERRKMGMSITWAAVLGAGARLRPILMTSLAMIIGLLPLMFALGVGANGNRSLGATAIGGMLIGMIFQLFVVPSLFVIFQYLQEKFTPMVWEDIDNADAETEIEQYSK